jgi:pimeloyl-ACP methyl ester carboxylesterase
MTVFYLLQRLFALFSLAILAGGGYLVWSWWDVNHDDLTLNDGQDWRLYTGAALLAWSLLGRFILPLILAHGGAGHGRMKRSTGREIAGPDGATVRVESYGPAHAPPLIFTHGWGMDSTIWHEAKQTLSQRFRVVVWDLPGLGKSSPPKDGHIALERYAADLRRIVEDVGGPAVLVGHSIGGMIVQTYGRLFPETLGREIAGIVLENTTHTEAHRTTVIGGLVQALRPLVEFLMRLDVWLQPLVWLMNWQSYLSGSTHLAMRLAGFGTQPTRAQLDQASLLATRNSPAVQAKGNLAMMHWGVTDSLPQLRVPALVFIGGRDIVTLPQAGERIAELLPQATLLPVREAGHMGPVELASIYNSVIAEFADRVFTAGALRADAPPRTPGQPWPEEGEGQPPRGSGDGVGRRM